MLHFQAVHSAAPTDRVGGGSAEMTSMRPPRDVAELAEDVRSRLNDLLATAEMRSLTADVSGSNYASRNHISTRRVEYRIRPN